MPLEFGWHHEADRCSRPKKRAGALFFRRLPAARAPARPNGAETAARCPAGRKEPECRPIGQRTGMAACRSTG